MWLFMSLGAECRSRDNSHQSPYSCGPCICSSSNTFTPFKHLSSKFPPLRFSMSQDLHSSFSPTLSLPTLFVISFYFSFSYIGSALFHCQLYVFVTISLYTCTSILFLTFNLVNITFINSAHTVCLIDLIIYLLKFVLVKLLVSY